MRKFAKTLAVVSVFTPAGVGALGVGEIKLHSALNQKLLAEIPLLSSPGEDVSEFQVRLASPEAFAKAGLPRPYYLSNLRFKPVRKPDGSMVIRVTSTNVIREPFLDFLVEVDWPQGRMLREFTVLLDPPVTFADAVKVVQKLSGDTPRTVPKAPLPAAASEYGPVQRNESLWTIAEKLKPDASITTEQMVMALYRENPHAFFASNANALKAGAKLKIPAREVVIQLSPSQARREFRQQYRVWMARKAPEPEPRAEQTQAANESIEPQLKLEAPSETELAKEQVEVPVVGNPRPDPETRKLIESLEKENDDLRARLETLEKQISALLEVRNARLAALQSQGAQDTDGGSSSAERVAERPEATPAKPPLVAATGRKPPSQPLPKMKPAGQPAEVQRKPATPKHAVEDEAAFPGNWFNNTFYLSIGGGSLFLLGLAGWMIRRRRQVAVQQADSLLVDTNMESSGESAEAAAAVPLQPASGPEGKPAPESSFLIEFASSDLDILEAEGEAVDPLTEADVYLAYGRYQQAEELVKQALAGEPERPDLRLKLLEIYYAKEDGEAFENYAQELHAAGAHENADFWEKVVEMGRELCPDSSLFAAEESVGFADAPHGGSAGTLEDHGTSPDLNQKIAGEEATSTAQGSPDEDEDTADGSYHLDFDLGDLDLGKDIPQEEQHETKEEEFSKEDAGNILEFSPPSGDAVSEQQEPSSQEDLSGEDFDLTDLDELETKLDLARAYADMEDVESARGILEEILASGDERQKQEAQELLDKLGLIS